MQAASIRSVDTPPRRPARAAQPRPDVPAPRLLARPRKAPWRLRATCWSLWFCLKNTTVFFKGRALRRNEPADAGKSAEGWFFRRSPARGRTPLGRLFQGPGGAPPDARLPRPCQAGRHVAPRL